MGIEEKDDDALEVVCMGVHCKPIDDCMGGHCKPIDDTTMTLHY